MKIRNALPIIVSLLFVLGLSFLFNSIETGLNKFQAILHDEPNTESTNTRSTALKGPGIGNLYFTKKQWDEKNKNTVFKSDTKGVYAEFIYETYKDVPVILKSYLNYEYSDGFRAILSKDKNSYSIQMTIPVKGLYTVRIIYDGLRMATGSFKVE